MALSDHELLLEINRKLDLLLERRDVPTTPSPPVKRKRKPRLVAVGDYGEGDAKAAEIWGLIVLDKKR